MKLLKNKKVVKFRLTTNLQNKIIKLYQQYKNISQMIEVLVLYAGIQLQKKQINLKYK